MIQRIEHGEIHELHLDRPPVNAMSPELLNLLASEVRAAPGRGARAVIVSGRRGMFSGGLDIPVLLALDRQDLERAVGEFFDALETVAASAIPVAAAITGHSPAGGAVLAMCCDYRVMAEGPFGIGLNEVRIGIPMPEIVASLLRRTVGVRRAEELCVTGRLVGPGEALAMGLIDEVAPPELVVESARSWCERALGSPPAALAETRTRLRRDLLEFMRRLRADDIRRLADSWFEPELQRALRDLVTRLKAK
jgi:enoyl-CoA hydratase/carnithine racemase